MTGVDIGGWRRPVGWATSAHIYSGYPALLSGLRRAVMLQDHWLPHRQQVALVDELALSLLQLRAQAPQLALVLAQQSALVHVLVHLSRGRALSFSTRKCGSMGFW